MGERVHANVIVGDVDAHRLLAHSRLVGVTGRLEQRELTRGTTVQLKGRCSSKNCFARFSTHSFHCTFIMISMKKYGEKNFPCFVSMEMVAIFDFRALTKVHITLKPLLQMQ